MAETTLKERIRVCEEREESEVKLKFKLKLN